MRLQHLDAVAPASLEPPDSVGGAALYYVTPSLDRIFHELLSRDHKDGRATWQLVPRDRGIGFEAYLNGTSQDPTPEDARKHDHIRGSSK